MKSIIKIGWKVLLPKSIEFGYLHRIDENGIKIDKCGEKKDKSNNNGQDSEQII